MSDLGAVTLDREAMVLARDEDAVRTHVEHRVVGAAVPERELEGLEAGRERKQLVAETDAEERYAPDQLGDDGSLRRERSRVARAVGEDDAVVPGGEERLSVGRVRIDGHACPRGDRALDDRALAPVVEDAERDRTPADREGR